MHFSMAYSKVKKAAFKACTFMVLLAMVIGSTPLNIVLADVASSTPTPSVDGGNGGNGEQGGNGTSTDEENANTDDGENGDDGDNATTTEEGDGTDGTEAEEGDDGDTGNVGTGGLSATSTATTTDGLPASVGTGNATSGTTVVNEGNINTTNASSTGTSTTDVVTANQITGTNTASTSAQTGDNEASDPDGARIVTGDADSFGVLVSLFNVVVTNSSGALLFLQNPLGGVDLTDRFTDVFKQVADTASSACSLLGCSTPYAIVNLITDNIAEITNSLIVRSGTGGNAAHSDGDTSIETGDASAFGSVINFGNLQIVDSRYLVILMQNQGDLTGDIVLPTPEFFKELSTAPTVVEGTPVDIKNQNTALIENNGSSTADSGVNNAQGTSSALIDTGNANSSVDVHNFVNENSFGGRPICFIVSVGGKWNGNVVGLPENFNREKTPLGEVICGAGGAERGTTVGNLTASTTNYAKILNNVIVEATTGGNTGTGDNVTIETGDADSFLQILNVVNQNIIGQDWVFAMFTVSEDWNGDLMFGSKEFWNNVNEQVTRARGGGGPLRNESADILIEKTANKTTTTASSTVDYTITLKNKGGAVYEALLVDTIFNEKGEPINEQRWGLDTIAPKETITLSYSVFFNADTEPGLYTNEAFVHGVHRHPNWKEGLGDKYESPAASAQIEITDALEEVLAAFDAPQCQPYLTTYMRMGLANDPVEVLKLQKFLMDKEGASLTPTGVFDEATDAAVKAFQIKYAADILNPWGVPQATGFVYYTTQLKINQLYCAGQSNFALTPMQQEEIDEYRSRITHVIREDRDLPETINEEVGEGDSDAPFVGGDSEGTEIEAPAVIQASAFDAASEAVEEIKDDAFTRVKKRINTFFKWLSGADTSTHQARK